MFARLTPIGKVAPQRENREQFSAKTLKLQIARRVSDCSKRENAENISTAIVSREIKLTSYVNHM